ncbi:hypothetical protein [Paenibacillus tundrae]|uniref:SbsC C-terminal domain-containing protein n=1 Tax=Paenibacillus tundrae TaxID=528187 RepID=A0ABT9W9G7_9BACL|nr:hypothetical protein [Paenibacillus tundrae]MDQ0169699.1 hypothetical protein [Paenibacillus tundrae]
MKLNASIKLGILALTLGCTTVGAVLSIPQAAWAAPVPDSKAVYLQFQKYWKNAVKSSASLIQARKYLLNHVHEVNSRQATLMTMQLESVQNMKLAEIDEKIYADPVQTIISEAHENIGYDKKLTYSSLLKEIKDPATRKLLQEASNLGYKLETSEGIYYPIINYEGYKRLQPYVAPDIAAYIDIMATESNQASTSDAALIIPWGELIQRTLAMEAFLNSYPQSSRTTAVENLLYLYVHFLFYGSDNTPAYDWFTKDEIRTLIPEVKQAYDKALAKREPVTKSAILDSLERVLALLEQTNDRLTPDIQATIESILDRYSPE